MKYKKYNDYELLYLLSWHSEEALEILMEKYDNLILIKLAKFNVLKFHYPDYIQELRMAVFQAINKYDDRHGKTLCRYLELVIDRKIARLLSEEVTHINCVAYIEEVVGEDGKQFLDKMIYEQRLDEINQVELDDLKKEILQKVIIEGESVKTFALEHNICVKDVYNHVYMLRLKLRSKINL